MSSTPFSQRSLEFATSTPKFSPSQFKDLYKIDSEFNIFCSAKLKRSEALSPISVIDTSLMDKKDDNAIFLTKSLNNTPKHFELPDLDSLFNTDTLSSMKENSPLYKIMNTPGVSVYDINMYKNLCENGASTTPIEQILSTMKIVPNVPVKTRTRALTRLNKSEKIVENFWDKINHCDDGITTEKKRVNTPKNATKLHRRRTNKIPAISGSA